MRGETKMSEKKSLLVDKSKMPLAVGVAFVAFTTQFGGGFASGAQIYQYFINYGIWGLILPVLAQFLLAFFFYIDGVYTIIDMATAYGSALGLDSTGLLLALLVTQIVAFPCAIVFGRLAGRCRNSVLITICICAYLGIAVFAIFLVSQWQFWLLAVLVGMFQGAIQALSRSYLGKIIPAERSGAYYGLMDICGKGASFLGALLIGIVNQATIGLEIPPIFGIQLQNENLAVGTLIVLFIIGYLLFCKADKLNKE